MTDKELAAKVCALLPQDRMWEAHCDNLTDTEVVNDWEIAGTLMEKALLRGVHLDMPALVNADSFPRAIIETCVEALSND